MKFPEEGGEIPSNGPLCDRDRLYLVDACSRSDVTAPYKAYVQFIFNI
jgi:hypothetical protein